MVFRCHDLGAGRDVALKVLPPHLCAQHNLRRRFEREAQSAARIDHPNCARFLDAGTDASRDAPSMYICMELVEGTKLTHFLYTPVERGFFFDIVGQVLDGLAHAHGRGVVHRDLKPDNILVARRDTSHSVKIVDFGLALLFMGDEPALRVTKQGDACGTPTFMSPEQILGGDLDGRSDLYSLGIVMFWMLEGRPPFAAKDVASLLRMQVDRPPPPLSSAASWLEPLVRSLLAKDRKRRPADAGAVRVELDRLARR